MQALVCALEDPPGTVNEVTLAGRALELEHSKLGAACFSSQEADVQRAPLNFVASTVHVTVLVSHSNGNSKRVKRAKRYRRKLYFEVLRE